LSAFFQLDLFIILEYFFAMEIKIEDLVNKVGLKYALASLIAKRAHEIKGGDKILVEDVSGTAEVIALRELYENKLIPKLDSPAAAKTPKE